MDEANMLLNFGNNYFKWEKYDMALGIFLKLAKKDPTSVPVEVQRFLEEMLI
jgi:hypothetical protein